MTKILVRKLGCQPYEPTWRAMQAFTEQRGPETEDELWIVEHPPVYTLGLNGKPEHLLAPGEIPVVAIDRGGQVTYHGPGQLVIYLLINVKRQNWGIRRLVTAIEEAVIGLLADYGVEAKARADAPGVYVADAKVAALGLRVRRGCSYHGLSLNVAMDLSPFQGINPCGYPGMAVTQLQDLGISDDLATVADKLVRKLCDELGLEPQLSPVTDSNQVL
jgi:lipoyl(octanoyl) transferase